MTFDNQQCQLSEETLLYQSMPNQALMKMSKASLVNICKLYNYQVSGNRKGLVDRIQLGPSASGKVTGTHLEILCANWFLRRPMRSQKS